MNVTLMNRSARIAATLFFGLLAGSGTLSAQTSQNITFDSIPSQLFGRSPFAIAAEASSGLPVVLTSNTPAVCATASVLVTLLGSGTCSITASQAGNGAFSQAPSVTRKFAVNQATLSSGLTPAAASPFTVGTAPQSVAVGDFNGDGIPDMATANGSGNTVTVLLGDGLGGFAPSMNSPFAVGSNPLSIGVGDFNGDGSQDLAVANLNDGTVTVLLGDGTGGFAPSANSPFTVGTRPAFVAVGDFNGDGIQDLAVANFGGNTVTILLGDGAGNFTAAGSPITVGTSPSSLAVADFNGDGFEDLAIANYGDSTLTVLLGNGSGGFTAATGSPYAGGTGNFAVVVGDFNADGVPDLAIANYSGNNVTVLLGQSSGGFTAAPGSPFTVGTNPYSLVVEDLNGDGFADLAVANFSDATFTVLLGNGTGAFTPSASGPFAVGSGPDAIAAGDFNGDGRPDLAVANGNGNSLTVFLGAGQSVTTSVLTTTAPPVIALGSSVALTLTVSGATPEFSAPSGTATFSDGMSVLGTAAGNASPYTFTATGLALGAHTLSAAYAGDSFNSASTSNTITITVETAQSITFPPLPNVSFGVAPFAISATASSTLPVSFTSATPAVCTVSMNTVTIVTGGTCSITASQQGDATFAPAQPVTQSFTVTNGPQSITFDSIPTQIFGASPLAVAAQASSGLPVTLTSTTPAVCTNVSILVTLLSAGTCSITATQAGTIAFNPAIPVTQSFTVNLAKPSSALTPAASPFAVGAVPQAATAADFNGDGVPDLAVANGSDNTVTVLIGDGLGGFTAATNSPFAVGGEPVFVISGDFNGDSKRDLATANFKDGTVTVLLGDGTGGFAPASGSPIQVGTKPGALAVGDFNGDGIQDLAVTNFGDSTVTILLGNGQGSFTPAGSPIAVGTNPASVVVADFNADGFEDIAVANYSDSTVTLLLGNGAGGFAPAKGSPFTTGTNPAFMVVGDFNGDGVPDLATANYTSSNVTVLLGNGSGGFATPAGSPFAVGKNPYSMVVEDFNGDGFPDLAVGNYTDGTVTVLLGSPSGTFVPAASAPLTVGTSPDAMTGADFNRDGLPDLAVVNGGSNNLTVLLGFGPAATNSVLTTTSALVIGVGQSVALTLTVSDNTPAFTAPTGAATFLDGMKALGAAAQTTTPYTFTAAGLAAGVHTLSSAYAGDAVSTASTSNTITITVESAQTITFLPLSNVNFGAAPFTLTATASSNLPVKFVSNTPAVCTVSVSTVTIVTGGTCSITASQAGNAVYAPAPPVTQSFTVTHAPQTLTFDPIPNQIFGASPFVAAAQSSSLLPVALASTTPAICRTISVLVTLLSTGTCSITASQPGTIAFNAATSVTRSFTVTLAKPSSALTPASASPFTLGSPAQSVAVGDFNGDGIPDVASALGSGNAVAVLLGDGLGGFTAATHSPYAVGSDALFVVVGDFNGDSKQDLAVANFNDGTVTVLLGDGAGGFAAASGSPVTVGAKPASIAVGDFNADGIQDLAVANFGDSTVTVLIGDGQGGFTAASGSPFAVGTSPASVAVADFNKDSMQDLAVANYGAASVTLLLGNGSGGFAAASGSPFAVGTNPISVAVGDFNGDGVPDLAVANNGSNNVTVLLGNGSAGFGSPRGSPFAVGTNPNSLVVQDFNGDGVQDLAVANFGSSTVTLLIGNALAGFSPGTPIGVATNPDSIAVADFNGDGLPDLAIANSGSNNLTVLLGIGVTPQTITFTPINSVTIGVAPFAIVATASSNLPVTLVSTTTAVCTLAGSTVTILTTGTCSITASQPGNGTYATATTVTRSFTVSNPAPPPPPPPPPVIPPPSAPLSINTPGALAEIALGSSVSTTFIATGGSSPYIWTATSLPKGLALSSTSGALTGVPALPGNYSFTVAVADSASTPNNAQLMVTLPVLGITTAAALPGGLVGRAYSQKFAAAGGSGTYTFSSSDAPAGLAFSGATLAGTPTTAGTSNFHVQVSDQVAASSSFSIVILPALSVSAPALSEISFGSGVNGTLKATGGVPPYTWSASNLPPGVTLNSATGALGGTPSQPGNYSFTAQVSDSETPAATKSLPLALQVLGLTNAPTLPGGSTLAAYSQTFTVAGGTGPYTFSSPNAPPGLSFTGAALAGTPATVGVFNFTVVVSDSTGFSISSAFSLTVTGPGTPLLISGGAVANGTPGLPYSQSLTGTGGAPPYSWTIIGGALPPGLSLDPSGAISGTPSAPGMSTFTAQATDNSNASSSGVLTITITPLPLSLSGLPFPSGIAGADYPPQVLTASGGVAPYTFTVANGSLPPGLSLTSGQIVGTPSTAGTFSFAIATTDAEAPALTLTSPAQIVVAAAGGANLMLSAASLSFNLSVGAAGLPAPAGVTVESSAAQQSLHYSAVPSPAVPWLDVSTGGTTPGNIAVALDPSATNLGASAAPLTTGLVVTCIAPSPCAGMSQTVAVSLSVANPPPQLAFTTNLVPFGASAPATAPLSQQVAIQNAGGGSAIINSVAAADPWLTVGNVPAAVPAGPPVNLTFTANPAGLGTGLFRTTVTIQSSAGTIAVPVTLDIAPLSILTLSSSGAQFRSTLGSTPLNTTGSFQVGATGVLPVNWTASVLPGAPWLKLNQFTASGTASKSSAGTVNYTLDPTALTAAQPYFGTIRITAPGVANSPQDYPVVLNVADPSVLPVPVLQPAGLLFQAGAGGAAPPAQNVSVYSTSGSGTPWSAATGTSDGNSWLTVAPATGTSSTSTSVVVSSISVNPGTLPAGIYTGTVSYQFPAAAVRTVSVTMIVAPGAGKGCTPTQLVATQTGLTNNFAQSMSWPTPLSVLVADNCGSPVANAQVVVTLSNGDPPLSANVNAGTNLYSATWIPRTAGQVTVTETATAPGLSPGVSTIAGAVVANTAPLLVTGGTLHVFDPLVGGALGQGTILQIYGANLSASTAQATAVPLPTTLGNTSVTIGGITAPLFYVSPNQIDAQLPYELTPGYSYQVIVNSNGAVSMPDSIVVAAATPGVAAFASGLIVAQHADLSLVSETSPAKPGEYLVIYLSGLGLTNQSIADGAATPASPLATPLVAPTLTLNGVGIPIYFSGLTPGDVGLYQMNFQVPANTPNGDIQLVVSQGGQSGNPAILPVHK